MSAGIAIKVDIADGGIPARIQQFTSGLDSGNRPARFRWDQDRELAIPQ